MKQESTTEYKVTYEGMDGFFAKETYSKYEGRMNQLVAGTLPMGEEVYGFPQAIDHIKELKVPATSYLKWNVVIETISIVTVPDIFVKFSLNPR